MATAFFVPTIIAVSDGGIQALWIYPIIQTNFLISVWNLRRNLSLMVGVNNSTAIVYRNFGNPGEVLQIEERKLLPIKAGMVRLKLRAAVIQPSDLGMIGGSYGKLKQLPAVAGREGVAEVVEVAGDVTHLKPGDRVRFPEEEGAWQTACVTPARDLWKIPNDVPLDMAAMAFINPPTAWRLLRDGHLQEGDWVLQNAANSAVGQFVIQIAKKLKVQTLNVVRNEIYCESLRALGGDHVFLEESGYEKRIDELTSGKGIRLALNSIGGPSALRQVKALGLGGRQITFGGMSRDLVRFPTRELIFNQIELSGFWLDLWYRQNSRERIQIMFDRIFALMKNAELVAPVAGKFKLTEIREALEANRQPRTGKILLIPDEGVS